MDAIGALALGLLGAGLYLDDADDISDSSNSSNSIDSSGSSSSSNKSSSNKKIKTIKNNQVGGSVGASTNQSNNQVGGLIPTLDPQGRPILISSIDSQPSILGNQTASASHALHALQHLVGPENPSNSSSLGNSNLDAGKIGYEGYLNQVGPIPDMPPSFQLELYNTLQLSESERKIKNPNWDPKAVLLGLPNCLLQSGQDKPGEQYKNDLNACRGTGQVVPKYQLALENNKFCMEPNNAMAIPYDDSERNRPETMTHTNMVPFYRGTLTQSMDPDNRLGAHKLELYTGNYKLRQDNKQEVGQFFAPTTGLSLPYGSHECRDLTRYNPNNTGKRNNEKPFQDIHVGRGLNKGFTNEGSGGFHDMLRILPKRGDQIYVNPKSETKGMINHGKAINDNGTLRPVVYKYKTNLLVNNEAGQRNFSTVGAVTGRRLRPDIVLKDTNRVISKPLYGPRNLAAKTLSTSSNLIAKAKVSSKQNFANSPWRNLNQTTGKRHNDYGQSGIENRLTERSLYSDKTYWGHLKTWVSKVINDYTDKARHTRKQDNLCAPRKTGPTAGNVGQGNNKKAGKVYDPTDVLKTTIRETTENLDYRGLAKGQLKGQVYDPTDVTKTTIRQTTENFDYNGGAKGQLKGKAYDPTDVTKTTIRQTTENFDYNGSARGQLKGKAYDPTDVLKTTIRQTTENFDYQGLAKGQLKGKAYDPTDVTKTTIRQTTENFDYNGGVRRGILKGKAYDPTDVTKTTIRETVENFDYNGSARGQLKGKAYDPTDVMKTTIRQTTETFDYNGSARGQLKGKAYDPTDVTKTTIRQTTENFDYNGSARGQFKGKAYDPTDVTRTTVRETTENLNYQGQVGGAPVKKSIAYDPTDVTKTTVRETTENFDYNGVISRGPKKGKAYDPTDVTKTTIRETTENFNYNGGVRRGVLKGKAYDPTDVLKTTIRQTTENLDYKGQIAGAPVKKSIAYDPTDVTKTTIRETTENNDYLGGPSSETFQNGGAYATTAACAPATQRQFSLRSYAGGADAVNPGMTSYDSSYNMTFNPATELLVTDYAQQPAKVIPLNNNNTPGRYEVKKLEDDRVNRWMGPKQTTIENYFNPNAITACTNTSLKNRLPEDFTRLDTRILDAYKNNPLTQSLNSYA